MAQATRVLYCILDNRFGGPHRRTHAIALRLRPHQIETILLTGRKTDDLWMPEGMPVVQLKHIQCFQRRGSLLNLARFLFWLPYNVLRIRRLIRSEDIAIVHVDGVTNFVPALAAAITGRPVVWTYNDHLPAVLKRLLLPLVRRCARVVLVQGHKLKELRTADDPQLHAKTQVLYTCVDTHTFDPQRIDPRQTEELKQTLGLPPDCAVVGMIGNLNRFKGHPYFIEAAARIKKQIEKVKFLIVGRKLETDHSYWGQLQQLTAEKGLQEDIVYAGFRDDIPAVIAAMDVFVLPSLLESCPVVVLEAMAMEVPVVATDVGAVSELVTHGQTGRIVPAKDPDAIAQAVVDYLTKSAETENIARAARKRVEAEFDVDRIAKQQLCVYEGLSNLKSRI